MAKMRGDGMVSVRTFLMGVMVFGLFQIFFLLQINYTNMRQIPNQCDCQCTKQLHINRDNLRESDSNVEVKEVNEELKEIIVKPAAVVPKKSEEERNRMQILEAEDKALDREIAANQTKRKQEIVEDPEERSPYQPERLSGADTNNSYIKLVSRPLDVNPLINASSLQCADNSTDLLLFYIYTAPQNFEERGRIRESYGSVREVEGKKLQYIFFIGGLSEENHKKYYNKLLNESKTFGDLVQDVSYLDAYRNLTLKGISALRWVAKYCPITYRVIKIDDDTMVNPFTLVYFLHGQSAITMSELVCKVTQGVGPIRNPKSKYFVHTNEYADDYYPPYCQGYGYIFPPYVIPLMVEAFDKNPLIAMEDVFFTGITSQQISLRLHPLTALYATTFNRFELFLERITTRPELLMVGHVHEARYVETFWQLAKQRESTRVKNLKKEKHQREKGNKKSENNPIDGEDEYAEK